MALFNKLFSSRKKSYNKYQDNVCDKLFHFTNDQVRVVLFRECDFRGRKLLFDSQTVQKVPLVGQCGQQDAADAAGEAQKKTSKYIEISNGYGYLYTKPNSDVAQLGEMIFGSVAMSYRGTSYKIHSLTSPSRLMCTQVFQSPRHPGRGGRSSAPSRTYMHGSRVSSQSLEHSLRLEDSSASMTSFSDHSMHSTASDNLLVCRGGRSVPLDVPQANGTTGVPSSIPISSLIGDSGFCGEQSYSSASSGPQSVPTWDTNKGVTFSCGSLYKRWLRSASTSLEYSTSSLTGSASADECFAKPHPRTSKLGLAVVIQFTNEQEERLEEFLMDHAALIEGMVWRARQGAETAYVRHSNFVSLMLEVAVNTAQWLVDLLSGPKLTMHMWLTISTNCDSSYSIINNSNNYNNNKTLSIRNRHFISNGNGGLIGTGSSNTLDSCKSDASVMGCSFKSDFSSSCESTSSVDKGGCGDGGAGEFTFLNITRFFKSEWDSIGGARRTCTSRGFAAEKFVRELCELLETVDVKHTNFFISTLITAVLTHHLGWVATALKPSPDDAEMLSRLQKTGNPLWGQLNDLYGAVGHPTKMAQTVITGSNKSELITKILNTLTYFIRCSDIDRKTVRRVDAETETVEVNRICHENSCIPKENYKKYEDHLKEIAANSVSLKKFCNGEKSDNKFDINGFSKLENCAKIETFAPRAKNGLTRTNTCLADLNKLVDQDNSKLLNDIKIHEATVEEKAKLQHEIMDKITTLGLQAIHSPPLESEKQFDFCLSKTCLNSTEMLASDLPSDKRLEKLNGTITRMPKTSVLSASDENTLVSICEAKEQVERIFCIKKVGLKKRKSSCMRDFFGNDALNPENAEKENVVFVLGDDDVLAGLHKNPENKNLNPSAYPIENKTTEASGGLKRNKSFIGKPYTFASESYSTCPMYSNARTSKLERPTTLNIPEKKKKSFSSTSDILDSSSFNDSDFVTYEGNYCVKPSTSWTELNRLRQSKLAKYDPEDGAACSTSSELVETRKEKEFSRSQSVPPEGGGGKSDRKTEAAPKYRYTGVKFNFQQHPQIFQNYMRSKNIDLSNLSFSEKAMKFNNALTSDFIFSDCQGETTVEVEALQTPSNASELEFTSELVVEKHDAQQAKEVTEDVPKTFVRNTLPNTMIKEARKEENARNLSKVKEKKENSSTRKMRMVELPMPKTSYLLPASLPTAYTCSLFRGVSEHYISDMVLQGTSSPKSQWEAFLRKDLGLAVRHPLLDQPLEEAVAIVANTDTWEVQLMSSHTYVIDKGSSGVRVGMSQLVANMLESLLHMWKLNTPPEYCLMHIEQRLQEFCARSKALAQLLLATDFCSMELLTSALQLEVNDVPLLMAVASTHSPQIMQKYGLSFQ